MEDKILGDQPPALYRSDLLVPVIDPTLAKNFRNRTLRAGEFASAGPGVAPVDRTIKGAITVGPIVDLVFEDVTDPNFNLQTGATYTLLASDRGKTIEFSNAGAITLTVTTAFSGLSCVVKRLSGAGTLTVVAGGVTIYATSPIIASAALIEARAGVANTFDMHGGLGSFIEDVQDVVGALVVSGGGSYDDSTASITFPFPSPLPVPLQYSDNGGIRIRTPSSGDNYTVGVQAACELINLTTTIAALTITLGSPPTDSEVTVSFIGLAGQVTALTWAGAALKPPAASALLPVAIYGPTTIQLFWDYSASSWQIENIWRAYDIGAVSSPVASAATVNLWQQPGRYLAISGTVPITSFGTDAPIGTEKIVQWLANAVVTHNGTTVKMLGGQHAIEADSYSRFVSQGPGLGWAEMSYSPPSGNGNIYVGVLSGLPSASSVPVFAKARIDEAAVSGVKMQPPELVSTYSASGSRIWKPNGRQPCFMGGGNNANPLFTLTAVGATGTIGTLGTFPANLLTQEGVSVYFDVLVARGSTAAATATIALTLGGVDVAVIATLTASTTRAGWLSGRVWVRTATTQSATATLAPQGQANAAATSSVAITATSAVAVTVTISAATAGDIFNVLAYTVGIE